MVLQPREPVRKIDGRVVPDRGRGTHGVVVDVENTAQVGFLAIPDHHAQTLCRGKRWAHSATFKEMPASRAAAGRS